jgi:DNA (cytosine-5)-methyltransferase 1
MNYLDLFHGIGGFALGAYWAGMKFENHYCSDIEPYTQKLYKLRFPDSIQLGDIRGIDGKKLMADAKSVKRRNQQENIANGQGRESGIEPGQNCSDAGVQWIITGGFPCQDISIAGKGAGIHGERSGLWFEYWRLIRDLRPRFAIMENVGMLVHRGLREVLGSLAEIGYDAEWQDIRASDVGAPHRRERIWIVAYPASNDHRGNTGKFQVENEQQATERPEKWICDIADASQGTDVADTTSNRRNRERENATIEKGLQPRPGNSGKLESGFEGCSFEIPDTTKPRLEREESTWKSREHDGLSAECRAGSWATEPDVGRLANGVPHRVDRLKGLGNAIVPQIAELLFRQIKNK